MSRDIGLYLEDMLESCQLILTYSEGLSFEDFSARDMAFDAIVRRLMVLGEAAKHIPEEFRMVHPDIEWKKIAGLRDILTHGYFGLDSETLWEIVQEKLPPLLDRLQTLMPPRGSSRYPG